MIMFCPLFKDYTTYNTLIASGLFMKNLATLMEVYATKNKACTHTSKIDIKKAFIRSYKNLQTLVFLLMAEREGFEPSVQLPVHTLSRRAPSTARTSLH